jgi:hypothetical protein
LPISALHLIPPIGSAFPVLLLTSSVYNVFEVVGVDLPIRVSLTSGAGVIVVSSTSNGTNSVEREFIGQRNGTHLTIQPGEFKINVLPAKSVRLGWEYVKLFFEFLCW